MSAGGIGHFRLRNGSNICSHIGFILGHFPNLGAADAGDQNPQVLALGLQNLLDLGNNTNGIQVIETRVVIYDIFLGNQKNVLVLFHCRIQSLDGLIPAHIKMDRLVRKHRQTPQGQNRQFSGNQLFAQG